MKKIRIYKEILLLAILITSLVSVNVIAQSKETSANILTKQEIREGWMLLFDGKTTKGWRGANKDKFPDKGWIVENGMLTILPAGEGGDIISNDMYSNFELSFDFKSPVNSNSGFKYFVLEDSYKAGTALGLEYQTHDTGKRPFDDQDKHTLGCLYELLQATNRKANLPGEWNNARIISKGTKVEHWLNGILVLSYERGGEQFRNAVAKSKFSVYPNFGETKKGHLLIQDHNDRTDFRNIKIKELL